MNNESVTQTFKYQIKIKPNKIFLVFSLETCLKVYEMQFSRIYRKPPMHVKRNCKRSTFPISDSRG